MPLTIPSQGTAFHASQERLYKATLDAIVAGARNTGVVVGCTVTAQGTPDRTVAVAAGWAMVLGVLAQVTAGNATTTAPHASDYRLDLIVVSTAGTISVLAGTPSSLPVEPTYDPTTHAMLAQVVIPPGSSTVGTAHITDRRVDLQAPGLIITRRVTADITKSDLTLADVTGLTCPVVAGEYIVEACIFSLATAITTGMSLALNGPAVSALLLAAEFATTATASERGTATALATKMTSTAQLTTVTPQWMQGRAIFSAAGTAAIQWSPEVAAQATIRAGSWARLTRVA